MNDKARQAQAYADQIKDDLAESGIHCVELPTANQPATYTAGIMRFKDEIDLVIVGGGDGSLNASLAGLVATGKPLGVLPLGTANNFAKSLGLPLDLPSAIAVIASGSRQLIDLGQVNGQWFCNIAGFGVSSHINATNLHHLKKWLGPFVYALYALRYVTRMSPFKVRFTHQGQDYKIRTYQVTVANGSQYGAGLCLDNTARLDDKTLRVLIPQLSRWWEGLKYLPSLIKGEPTTLNGELVRLRGQSFRFESTRRIKVDADGEILSRTPAEFQLVADCLTVCVPDSSDTR
jgi:YegS/Rv2252/BmrU family lipid kinase